MSLLNWAGDFFSVDSRHARRKSMAPNARHGVMHLIRVSGRVKSAVAARSMSNRNDEVVFANHAVCDEVRKTFHAGASVQFVDARKQLGSRFNRCQNLLEGFCESATGRDAARGVPVQGFFQLHERSGKESILSHDLPVAGESDAESRRDLSFQRRRHRTLPIDAEFPPNRRRPASRTPQAATPPTAALQATTCRWARAVPRRQEFHRALTFKKPPRQAG